MSRSEELHRTDDDYFGWALGLGLGLGTDQYPRDGGERGTRLPLADDLEACSPQLASQDFSYLRGCVGEAQRASVQMTLRSSAIVLGGLIASPLVAGRGASFQMISPYAAGNSEDLNAGTQNQE